MTAARARADEVGRQLVSDSYSPHLRVKAALVLALLDVAAAVREAGARIGGGPR